MRLCECSRVYIAHFVLPTQYQKENHVIIILYLVIIHGRRRLRRHRLWFKLFWMDLLSMGPRAIALSPSRNHYYFFILHLRTRIIFGQL